MHYEIENFFNFLLLERLGEIQYLTLRHLFDLYSLKIPTLVISIFNYLLKSSLALFEF